MLSFRYLTVISRLLGAGSSPGLDTLTLTVHLPPSNREAMTISCWHHGKQLRRLVHDQSPRQYVIRLRRKWVQIPKFAATLIPMPEKLRLKWKLWLYGSVGALIGGGSSAVVSSFTAIALTPKEYNLNAEITTTLKLFGTCFLANGLISLFLWLKQRPVPELEPEDDPNKK